MSSNLTAEPTVRKKLELGTSLKFALRKKLGEPINCLINVEFIPFLEGIIAAGDKDAASDAQILIDFLNKYSEASLREEC